MDYKVIQENILGLSFSNYDKVSVLDKEDFDIEYQSAFEIIVSLKADYKTIYENGFHHLIKYHSVINNNNLSILVLLLAEKRFKELLTTLIDITIQNSESPSNALILSEVKEGIVGNDVFVLIDGVLAFLEDKNIFSNSEIKRFKDLQKYVEKRVNRIREVYK